MINPAKFLVDLLHHDDFFRVVISLQMKLLQLSCEFVDADPLNCAFRAYSPTCEGENTRVQVFCTLRSHSSKPLPLKLRFKYI